MQMFSLARAAACFLILAASACATGPKVRVDMDPGTNMRAYKTFAFFEPVATDNSPNTSGLSPRLKQATRAQLERLGYVYAESEPDLRVNFFLTLSAKEEVVPTDGYYAYRVNRYGTWTGYPYLDVVEYTEGTLTADLVEEKRKQLVWQGLAEGVVKEESLKNPGPTIDRVVAQIFSNFPNSPP
jgi:hypothetical protein